MSDGFTNVTITTTDTGWVLSKQVDGKTVTMTVTDKNKNGKLDAADTCDVKGGAFSSEEIAYAKKSIFQKGKPATTVGDYLNEQASIEEEEARAEAFERRQIAQRRQELEYRNAQLDKRNKKNTFWGKVGNIGSAVIGGISALAGFGFGFAGWQYNGCNWDDLNLRMFSSGTQGLEGLSTFMKGQYDGYTNPSSWLGSNQSFMPDTSYFADLAKQQAQYIQQQRQQYEDYMQEMQEAQAQKQQEQEQKATADYAKKLFDEINEEGAVVDAANKAKVNEIYKTYKKPSEYTAEDKEILNTIAAYPDIPYNAIAKDETETGKLSKEMAKTINDLLTDYDSNEKTYNLAEADYNYIKNDFLQKAAAGTLTQTDLDKIDNIIKKSKEKRAE